MKSLCIDPFHDGSYVIYWTDGDKKSFHLWSEGRFSFHNGPFRTVFNLPEKKAARIRRSILGRIKDRRTEATII